MSAGTAGRITEQEEAILRAWLGGHQVKDIAKGRRLEVGYVGRVIDGLCGYDRETARDIVLTGQRPTARAEALRQAPIAAALPARPVLAAPAPVPVRPEPSPVVPYAEYDAWRCRWCTYVGPAAEHRPPAGRVCLGDDDLEPVTVAILPRPVAQ